jgi:hypothetical protein
MNSLGCSENPDIIVTDSHSLEDSFIASPPKSFLFTKEKYLLLRLLLLQNKHPRLSDGRKEGRERKEENRREKGREGKKKKGRVEGRELRRKEPLGFLSQRISRAHGIDACLFCMAKALVRKVYAGADWKVESRNHLKTYRQEMQAIDPEILSSGYRQDTRM